ncbi:hypothetical protein RND71_026175 [Anisodus tanguticus]|uniref:Uncharacterized protein n=1 Tax=Anisodus tanguticus TaxID=243964 RepID=A0AAE1V835_9SOLA|nr:hypothetical protein RND71_026175 [Anisodus tanguticus]
MAPFLLLPRFVITALIHTNFGLLLLIKSDSGIFHGEKWEIKGLKGLLEEIDGSLREGRGLIEEAHGWYRESLKVVMELERVVEASIDETALRVCDCFITYAPLFSWLLQASSREQNERHAWVFGAAGFETTSSNKPVSDDAHIPAATAEQKYGDSKPCSSLPMIAAPLTSNPSAPLESQAAHCSPALQPAEEEEPYIPPIDLLDSTIDMWVRVVGNKKTDQEVTEEGLRHFYEPVTKYNEAVKASDDLEKMNFSLKDKLEEASRKLEDFKKEKERLEHELAGAENKITTLTGEKESLLKVQTIFHQKISS